MSGRPEKYGEKILIPGVQSPCGKNCPERVPDCRKTCRRWKAFEIAKQMEYARRKRTFEAAYTIQAPRKYTEKILRKNKKL